MDASQSVISLDASKQKHLLCHPKEVRNQINIHKAEIQISSLLFQV